MEDEFSLKEALGFGWGTMKEDFWFFAVLGIVFLFISILPSIVMDLQVQTPLPEFLLILFSVIGWLIYWLLIIILSISLLKMSLGFTRRQKPTWKMLWEVKDCFWFYVGAYLLYVLIVTAGLVLLVVPGVYFLVKYQYAAILAVDKKLMPVEALKQSSQMTRSMIGQLLVFNILCVLIVVAGLLCLFLGVFAAYPTALLGWVYVYRKLEPQGLALSELGIRPA